MTVTFPPRSSSRPVPCFSIPKSGVTYHWDVHGCDAPPAIAYAAVPGLSPSASPSGPYAAADATGRVVTRCAAALAAAALLACAAADALACAAALARAAADALAAAAALALAAEDAAGLGPVVAAVFLAAALPVAR